MDFIKKRYETHLAASSQISLNLSFVGNPVKKTLQGMLSMATMVLTIFMVTTAAENTWLRFRMKNQLPRLITRFKFDDGAGQKKLYNQNVA